MTTFEYGSCCGQLVRVNNPDGTWLGYEYDPNKNVVARSTPWGTTRYTFDRLNRMDLVIAADGGVTRYFYNAVGNRDSVVHANGTSVGYAYDALSRLLSVTNYGPGGGVQSRFAYELNPAGIRTAVVEADGSRVEYSYDDLYRLTGETRTGTHPYTIAFAYDNVGNRLTQTRDGVTISYSYNDRDQLMSETVSGATTTYAYDRAGRLVSKTDASGMTTYGWQDNDRMVSVAGPGVAVTYGYDHEGRRVEETTVAGTKRYLIDGLLPYGQVVAETDSAGSLVAAYVYGLERITQSRGGTTRTYAGDGQGSIRSLTAQDGTVTDNYWYTAFGEELARTGTTENAFRYVGEELDPNSGFYYNRARWMDPQNGRFVSVDPVEGSSYFPATQGRYTYARMSPVSFVDANGRNYTLVGLMAAIGVSNVLASTAIPKVQMCRCGMDAKSALRATYTDVANRFGAMGEDKRRANCDPFSSGKAMFSEELRLKAQTGWDMWSLTGGWAEAHEGSGCGDRGLGYQSVTVDNKCFDGWHVNYLLLGWINILCGNSKANLLAYIEGWSILKVFKYGTPYEDPEGKKQWALKGYGLDFTAPAYKDKKCGQCRTCDGESYKGTLDSNWPHSEW